MPVVYHNPGLHIIYPAPGFTDEEAAVAVPAGVAWEVAPPPPAPNCDWVNGEWVIIPPAVPELVSKLALVKAMREMGPDGGPVVDLSIWDAVKSAIAAAGGDVEEDWQLANFIPRHDATINMLAAQLVPTDPPRQQMLDALFLRASQLE